MRPKHDNLQMTICRLRRAFTLVEMLVLACVVAVLLTVFVPYVLKIRETSRRAQCHNNLRKIGFALNAYARDHREYSSAYPQSRHHPAMQGGYVAYSGADDPRKVLPNDVTASLWLLITHNPGADRAYEPFRPTAATFICPSAGDSADPLRTATGQPVHDIAQQRGNFRSGHNLSYSYCSPFSANPRFKLVDWLDARFAVMADKNPGVLGRGDNVLGPTVHSTPLEMRQANSNNHGKTGQNVLYADGHVEWRTNPYCGVWDDNIYTAKSAGPMDNSDRTTSVVGFFGTAYGPSKWDDSYLVPSDDQNTAAEYVRLMPAATQAAVAAIANAPSETPPPAASSRPSGVGGAAEP